MKTLSQFPSDVYIDPANGDLYVPNNDSLIGLNVFSRDVQGNVPPTRHLKSVPYGSYGITIDEERQELLLTVQHDGAIAAWKKTANGNDLPVRLIQGDRTRLGDPHGIALDTRNRLLYVVNFGTSRQTAQQAMQPDGKPRVPHWPAGNLGLGGIGRYRYEVVNGTGRFDLPSVTVFPKDAEGNVAPLRVIQGPKTQLNWPTGVAVDPDRDEVFVANDIGNSITVYSATANGDVAPIRVLKGPRTAIKNPTGVFVDVANDELWVANFGDHSATVYRRTASGDTAPIRTIRSAPRSAPATFINNPFAIVYDSRREEVLVPNCVQHPRIAAFPVMADKAALPVRSIEGQNTRLNRTVHSIGYDEIHDEIVVQSNIGQAILTFRGGASGDEAPIRVIQGPKTQLRDPEKLALDPVHNEIFVLNMTVDDEVLVFDRLAQGDVAPKRVLRANGGNLAVDTVHDLLVLTGNGIQIFDRAAGGDAKPLRRIEGGGGAVRVHSQTGMIVTTMRDRENGPYIGVWNVNDNGKVSPRWTVGKGMLKETRGITVDPKNKTIIVSDKLLAGVLTYSLPQMFERVETTTAAR
jgi:DNA-binding beta-propeller fold protein YncE